MLWVLRVLIWAVRPWLIVRYLVAVFLCVRFGCMGAPSSLFFGVSGVQVSVGVMVENVREGSGE